MRSVALHGVVNRFSNSLYVCWGVCLFFFQAEDGIRDLVRSRGLGDVYKRQRLTITPDPIASSLQASATAAAAVGITKSPPDLSGIYDLTLLNQVLTASGRPTVSAGGLGKE